MNGFTYEGSVFETLFPKSFYIFEVFICIVPYGMKELMASERERVCMKQVVGVEPLMKSITLLPYCILSIERDILLNFKKEINEKSGEDKRGDSEVNER